MSDKNLVTFFDALGRTIIGEQTDETTEFLTVKNPVVVNMVPQRYQDPHSGQVIERMALQLLPLFFKEFLADKDGGVEYNYNKQNITMPKTPVVFDFKLAIQYTNIFASVMQPVQTPPQAPQQNSGEIIKLFDD